jgi:hypothetical protein
MNVCPEEDKVRVRRSRSCTRHRVYFTPAGHSILSDGAAVHYLVLRPQNENYIFIFVGIR